LVKNGHLNSFSPKYSISFHIRYPTGKELVLALRRTMFPSETPESRTLHSEQCGNATLVHKWTSPGMDFLGCADIVAHFAKPGYQTRDLVK